MYQSANEYQNSKAPSITCFEVNMKVALDTFNLLPSEFWELKWKDAQIKSKLNASKQNPDIHLS